MMKRCFSLILLSCLASSCGGVAGAPFIFEENESHTLVLTTQTQLVIANTNGRMNIVGSDTAQDLQCTIAKKVTSQVSESDARSHMSDIEITVDDNAGSVGFAVDHPTSDSRSYEVNFSIVLPNNFDFVLTAVNGDATLQSVTTSVEIDLLNGDSNSDLTLSDGSAVSITVGNGNTGLTLPDNTNANLMASVVNGSISNDGLPFTNQQVTSTEFEGTLGNGDGNIALNAGNGHIVMDKK